METDVSSSLGLQTFTLSETGVEVNYRNVGDGDARFTLEVEDLKDAAELQAQLQKQLIKDFWFISPEIRAGQLKGKFGIKLDENTEVELFNFQDSFGTEQLTEVASTLSYIYDSLKDKGLWNLKTILVRAADEMNKKSGQPFKGKEFPQQQRFELFPASFEPGKFRGTMDCTTAQGAVAHETTHVVLEEALQQLWTQNKTELGWELLEDQLLILPGGNTTAFYNKDYEHLPSEYAGYQPDDDRAESVAAFLYDPEKLDEARKSILSNVFELKPDASYEIINKEPVLPELPEITVKTKKAEDLSFRIGKVTINPNPKPPLPIEEYRKIRKNSYNDN